MEAKTTDRWAAKGRAVLAEVKAELREPVTRGADDLPDADPN